MARHDAPDRTMPHGRKWKTGCLNEYKAPRWSQLSKTDMGTLERNGLTRKRPVGQPDHKARHGAPGRIMPHGSKRKTGCPNVHNAPEWSQLSKTDTGALE